MDRQLQAPVVNSTINAEPGRKPSAEREENMEIKNIQADFNPCYEAGKANNGGGYWQPYGTCTVTLEDGATMSATYEDTSCGDFGDRWYAEFTTGDGEAFRFAEDYVGSSTEDQASNDAWNAKTADRMFNRLGVDAASLIDAVSAAISGAAWDKFYAEEWVR